MVFAIHQNRICWHGYFVLSRHFFAYFDEYESNKRGYETFILCNFVILGVSPMNNCDRVAVGQELLSSDMRINIANIGSLPNNVISQVITKHIKLQLLCLSNPHCPEIFLEWKIR